MQSPDPPLPRPPADDENLRRLRREAAARMRQDEASPPEPITIYGAAPVYGGPPPLTRRWGLRGILALVAGALAALAAMVWAFFSGKVSLPAYGGPPAAVYGGPPPPDPPPAKDRPP